MASSNKRNRIAARIGGINGSDNHKHMREHRQRNGALFLQRFFKKKAKKDEARDALKAKENQLILKSIHAVGKLTVANSIALRDGKINGEMHAALEAYQEADGEMYEYLLEQNAKK